MIYIVAPGFTAEITSIEEAEKCIEEHRDNPDISFACLLAKKHLDEHSGYTVIAIKTNKNILASMISPSTTITREKAEKISKTLLSLKKKYKEKKNLDIKDVLTIIGKILENTGYREITLIVDENPKTGETSLLSWFEI